MGSVRQSHGFIALNKNEFDAEGKREAIAANEGRLRNIGRGMRTSPKIRYLVLAESHEERIGFI